jgi:cytochrome P450
LQSVWWLSRPIAFLDHYRMRYGPSFSVRFLGFQRPMVIVSDPEAIRALYTERAHGLPPGRSVALLPIMGASSVLLLEGEEHLRRRRLMLPAFHGERMRSYESVIRGVTEAEIDRWREGEPFELHPRMQALTLEVILHAVFGVTDSERAEQLRGLLRHLLRDSASTALQLRVLLSNHYSRGEPLAKIKALVGEIDELLFAEIGERRQDGALSSREDILSLLMLARFNDGTGMNDRELRDQLMTLLLAGHETTATALAWTFDLLLHNPTALARLSAEVLGGESDEYLRAVIAESLRLRPVVPLAGRRLGADLDAGDLRLSAGTDVTPAIWLTHTSADLYPEPLVFRPERFLDSPPSTYGWIPFGGGTRRCLGAAFAEQEMRVVLDTVLSRCTLKAVRAKPEPVARRNVTVAPRNGTRVTLGARRARPLAKGQPVAA